MKISVAMATYNGSLYLPEQLQSLLDQTRPPDEVIISDDCSTDNTSEIIKRFAESAPFEVSFLKNEVNLGYTENFNLAIMHTTGDLVFLCDQDDVWFPGKLAEIESIAELNPRELVIMNDASLTDAALNAVGLTKLGQIRSAGFGSEDYVMGCCCAIRRELLGMCMPIPKGVNYHDSWVVFFADALNTKFVSEQVLQFYRRHGNNESLFIANRTTKITTLHRLGEKLRAGILPVTEDAAVSILNQKRLLLAGIHRAENLPTTRYGKRLREVNEELLSTIRTLENRLEIRKLMLPARLLSAVRFWMGGGYQGASGISSFFRDLLGQSPSESAAD